MIRISKNNSLFFFCCFVIAIGLSYWALQEVNSRSGKGKTDPTTALIQDWYWHALNAERLTDGYRGPVAARMYGYAGLAAYEAARPMLGHEYQSLASLFPGLQLPPQEGGESYYLPAALNACYATIFENFFPTAPDEIQKGRAFLKKEWETRSRDKAEEVVLRRSQAMGEAIAKAVFAWSSTDTLGHEAYLDPYDTSFIEQKGEGKWKPCLDFPMPALLPHWEDTRPFLIEPEEYFARPHPEYSRQLNSPFYTQSLEVYTVSSPLSAENLWIAEFWSDDQPGLTFTPAGRWISISHQVIQKENPSSAKVLETYLKVGFSLADAFVACWKSKYFYSLERPESYITEMLDPKWRPVHHTPPFPSYPSGHSMIGSAAAEVLTQLYGKRFEMVDRSHEGRPEFKSKPRHYHSFYEMAFESSFSRISLGVHFRMDCEEGIRLGMLVGRKVSALNIRDDNLLSFGEK